MKMILFLFLLPLTLGAAGFFAGKMMAPSSEAAPVEDEVVAHATPQEILFKMPLGKFTIQVMQPKKVLHIVIDMDVYLAGASEFERLNGAFGRASLRDGTIAAVSDLAETTLWLEEGQEANIDVEELAAQIVRKLYREFHSIRTARINQITTNRSPRL